MSRQLRPPKPPHGQRLVITQIDHIARFDPDRAWVSIPIEDNDPAGGYRDITFGQFVNGADHAAAWLQNCMPASSEPFPAFAYAGPKDLRYAFLAVAAAKTGRVLVLPSSTVTPAAQKSILGQQKCTIYLHAAGSASVVNEVLQVDSTIRAMAVPEQDDWLTDVTAKPFPYNKSWDEAKLDPWLVFHTSGTTGVPKTIAYSQLKFASSDVMAGLETELPSTFDLFANNRVFTPMPLLHYVGMLTVLSGTTFANMVPVLGPTSKPLSPGLIASILKVTKVDTTILVPALMDILCRDPESLELLRRLKSIHYAGAPLGIECGKLLAPYVQVVPAIGSTEAGGYYIQIVNRTEDWDYISFQPHAGATFEPRVDNMYELVFIRSPECCMQQFFSDRPGEDRFATKDLWVEHPVKKGQWKIVGRTDDYVFIANGDGLYVSILEQQLEAHPSVRSALIGGQSRPKPVVILELIESAQTQVLSRESQVELADSLLPIIGKINRGCHESVQLDPRLVLVANPQKPFPRTGKDTVARAQAMTMYKEEIDQLYREYESQ